MSDYIERDKALDKFIEGDGDNEFTEGYNFAINEYREKIKAMPSADVQPVKQWISVKERLPETGKSVLIYYPKWDGDEIQVAKLEGDGMMFDICGEFNIGTGVITHWMPLPEPPKDGDTK